MTQLKSLSESFVKSVQCSSRDFNCQSFVFKSFFNLNFKSSCDGSENTSWTCDKVFCLLHEISLRNIEALESLPHDFNHKFIDDAYQVDDKFFWISIASYSLWMCFARLMIIKRFQFCHKTSPKASLPSPPPP